MKNIGETKIKKSIFIITTILYFISIIIFEMFFCNSELMNNIFRNTNIDTQYNFSLFRLLLYIAFFVALFLGRKYLIKDVLEENKSKVKKVIIILYSIVAILGIAFVTYCIFAKQVPMQRIAMLYIGLIMGEICLIYISKNFVKDIIVLTFTFGMMLIVTVDINNALDENKHFMSAYNVSIGNFNYMNDPKEDERFLNLGTRIKYTENSKLFKNDFEEQIVDLNTDNIAFTPADYGVITYLPSAVGIFVAKIFSNNMADIYYAGRLFNLLTFMGLMIAVFKILPYKKNTVFAILALPMIWMMSIVYTADMLAIAFTMIFIAYCLRLYDREKIEIKDIFLLIGAFALICIPKSMAYVFVALIGFILPVKKMVLDNKKYIPHVLLTLLLIIAIALFQFLNKDVEDDARGGNVNSVAQLQYMIDNPLADVKLVINHVRLTLLNMGWLAQMQQSLFFCDISSSIFLLEFLFILFVAVTDDSKVLKMKDKFIFWIVFFLIFAMNSILLYLKFTPVGSETIEGFQPRYLFPVLPLLLIPLANNTITVKNGKNMSLFIQILVPMFLFLGALGNIMVA